MGIGARTRVQSQFSATKGRTMSGRFTVAAFVLCAGSMFSQGQNPATQAPTAPAITTAPALNGAVIVSLATTTPNDKIYYTLDGATPTPSSEIYEAPFLVASSTTVKAIAANSP